MIENTPEQDNHWFIPKNYGYGLQPVSWQGWIATLLFVAMLLGVAYIDLPLEAEPSIKEIGRFIIDLTFLSAIFTILALPKTKGKLRWRWGEIDDVL
tara:strand:+ start:538 stop:828 length:291 start_codon:yes stop_codon:yes gene_type:complete